MWMTLGRCLRLATRDSSQFSSGDDVNELHRVTLTVNEHRKERLSLFGACQHGSLAIQRRYFIPDVFRLSALIGAKYKFRYSISPAQDVNRSPGFTTPISYEGDVFGQEL